MSITFKIKRGTLSQHTVYTGLLGELTMVTDDGNESVRVHYGETQGGFELARKDLSNINIPVGGVNFEYLFEENLVASTADISHGYVGFDNTDPSSASTLVVSERDRYGSDLVTFLNTIGTLSNATLGHFKLYRKNDASKFKIFEISGSKDEDQQFEFYIDEVASSITDYTHDEVLILSYISSGIDSITAFLTKNTHSFPSDTFGVIDSTEYTDGIFGVGVFLGLNVIKADNTPVGGVNGYVAASDPVTAWTNTATHTAVTANGDTNGATFDLSVSGSTVTVTKNAIGSGYTTGNVLTFSDPDSVGSDISITLTTVTKPLSGSYTTQVYNPDGSALTDIALTRGIDDGTHHVADQMIYTPTSFLKTVDIKRVKVDIIITGYNGQTKTIPREITYSKNKIGRGSELKSDDMQIAYDLFGNTPDPTAYTLTATALGYKTPHFRIQETNRELIDLDKKQGRRRAKQERDLSYEAATATRAFDLTQGQTSTGMAAAKKLLGLFGEGKLAGKGAAGRHDAFMSQSKTKVKTLMDKVANAKTPEEAQRILGEMDDRRGALLAQSSGVASDHAPHLAAEIVAIEAVIPKIEEATGKEAKARALAAGKAEDDAKMANKRYKLAVELYNNQYKLNVLQRQVDRVRNARLKGLELEEARGLLGKGQIGAKGFGASYSASLAGDVAARGVKEGDFGRAF